jgi:Flp pilus assembly protein TadG
MERRNRHQRGPRATAGQTLVVFALSSLVLLAGLGLVMDGGYNYVQRRAMQNAADAAATAGAQAIALGRTDTQVRQAAIDAALRNGVPNANDVTCEFFTNLYPAGLIIPCTTTGLSMKLLAYAFTGVRVRVAEQHDTLFMRAVGVPNSGTAATAAAQVQVPVGIVGGPFMVCAIETKTTSAPSGWASNYDGIFKSTTYYPDNGPPNYDRLDGNENCNNGRCGKTDEQGSGRPIINERAYAFEGGDLKPILYKEGGKDVPGPTFLIHAPNGSEQNGIEDCNNTSSSFKGVNLSPQAFQFPSGADFFAAGALIPQITTGNVSSVNATVEGLNGCKVGDVIDNCVMILPLVDNSGPGGEGSNSGLAVRMMGAFYVKKIAAGSHTGQLIKNYTIVANSSPNYIPGVSGLTVIRMVH